jgi:geranylgeranyl reductase family protein
MNAKRHVNVLVIGGGPAGSAAAAAAAGQGASVLLVERKSSIGTPVQCAEYIPALLLGKLDVGRSFAVQAVKGMKTYVPDAPEKITRAPGYIIHRDRFDKALARKAQDAGADIMPATSAVGIDSAGAVKLKSGDGRTMLLKPEIIIGADGPHSTVGRWVGAVNEHMLPAVQMTLPLTEPLDHTEVYFSPEIYAGYGWLFPKGKVANVGLGMKRTGRSQEGIVEILHRFIERLKKKGKITGTPVSQTAGWIPAEPVRRAVYGNIALAGDAAGHTHAITGAGIFAAVVCGQMAGKWAGRAVLDSDLSLLQHYDHEWKDLMALTLVRAYQRRQKMEAEWNDFNATVQSCWVAYRRYYA